MTVLKAAGKKTKDSLIRCLLLKSFNCHSTLKNCCLHLNSQIAGMIIPSFLFDGVIFYSFRKAITIVPEGLW